MNHDIAHSPRILCVDDNRDVADSEADLLTLSGFEVRTSYDGFAALAEAERFEPDICLLDYNMPGMDGAELALRLRERAGGRRILLVAVTATQEEECRHRIRAVFDRHLIKPASPRDLLNVIDEFREL